MKTVFWLILTLSNTDSKIIKEIPTISQPACAAAATQWIKYYRDNYDSGYGASAICVEGYLQTNE